jgi:hypothetical protein
VVQSTYVQSTCVEERSDRRAHRFPRSARFALFLAACVGPTFLAHGHGAKAASQPANQLSIQVNNDKLTLAAAGATQVYLYGTMDADAARRVEAMIRSRKIPRGSDVYLNSSGGDMDAGLALGRMFRAGGMVTHLGTPRRNARTRQLPKDALCVDACAYAYFGGLYRWAPTGRDRIGLHPISATVPKTAGGSETQPAAAAVYLKDMGIPTEALASTPSPDGLLWFDPDQMLAAGLANNGRLPLTATYQVSSGTPYLSLNQIVRNGMNRITVECKPDGLALTGYYMVGSDRARKVVTRATRSFFELDGREMLPQQRADLATLNDAIVTRRPYPSAQLAQLLSARSIGAWLTSGNNAVRYGFHIWLAPVRNSLMGFSSSCAQAMRRPGAPGR